jgi:transposase
MEFWKELWAALEPAAITLVTALVGYLVTKAASWLGEKANEAKQNIKYDIIADAVKWVEQKYIGYTSDAKYAAAAQRATELLEEKGIAIDGNELETMIESTVNAFNASYFTHKSGSVSGASASDAVQEETANA